MLENDNKVLRYEAKMENSRLEDRERRFIISYRLADDMISIFEPPLRNSGIIGGKFLERTRIAKPDSVTETVTLKTQYSSAEQELRKNYEAFGQFTHVTVSFLNGKI